jgi:outer membrane receptor protein involved in Fe transport
VAVSRAIRAPSRVDRDLVYDADGPGGLPLLNLGNKSFQSETMVAYEGGYRNYMLDNLTLDFAAFFNDYAGLTAINGGAQFVNGVASQAWGAETELAWQPIQDLKFVTSYA